MGPFPTTFLKGVALVLDSTVETLWHKTLALLSSWFKCWNSSSFSPYVLGPGALLLFWATVWVGWVGHYYHAAPDGMAFPHLIKGIWENALLTGVLLRCQMPGFLSGGGADFMWRRSQSSLPCSSNLIFFFHFQMSLNRLFLPFSSFWELEVILPLLLGILLFLLKFISPRDHIIKPTPSSHLMQIPSSPGSQHYQLTSLAACESNRL